MLTKSRLAIILSGLSVFEKPNVSLEQYPTDSEIAADILTKAALLGDIEKKKIADFGCGTGILAIGCAILGAGMVKGYDIDGQAIIAARENARKVMVPDKNISFEKKDIFDLEERFGIVVQNPPFGTRNRHADREFLSKAFESADVVYSLHKASGLDYLKDFIAKRGFEITHIWKYRFPLKKTLKQHRREIYRIDVAGLRIVKK